MTFDLTKDGFLFVCGTLMKGLLRSHLLGDYTFHGPAVIDQTDLYDLGAYPGIRNGSGIVVGELNQIEEKDLSILDSVEGYIPEDKPKSLFTRKATTVTMLADGRTVDAFCYYYNRDIGGAHQISHGDYRRFLIEKNETLLWVAAYGSNLDSSRLEERVNDPGEWKKGSVPGFKLVFNKVSKKGSDVYANISYNGEGESCPAVVYKLTREQAEKLDSFELGYIRMSLPFNPHDGEAFFVQGYVALPDWLTGNRRPPAWYVKHLQNGYREHDLDLAYLARALPE
jgi:gamma-glutamylcyclotransferase (GGCT)/AIG2-like uncharacterized protein YtfP